MSRPNLQNKNKLLHPLIINPYVHCTVDSSTLSSSCLSLASQAASLKTWWASTPSWAQLMLSTSRNRKIINFLKKCVQILLFQVHPPGGPPLFRGVGMCTFSTMCSSSTSTKWSSPGVSSSSLAVTLLGCDIYVDSVLWATFHSITATPRFTTPPPKCC